MNSLSNWLDGLPEVPLDQPDAHWIHTSSVTGPYGITAAVRNFAEVVDWQEHRKDLTQGYYRLILPPGLQRFKARLEAEYPGFCAVLYASASLAEKELNDYLAVTGRTDPVERHASPPGGLAPGRVHILDLHRDRVRAGVVLTDDSEPAADLHERNRRRGGVLSVRALEYLCGKTAPPATQDTEQTCLRELCRLEQATHGFMYPSGMAAVTAVLEEVLTPETPRILVVGNVYRDTHLILEEQAWAKQGVEAVFLNTDEPEAVARLLPEPDVAGVFLETVTNPLIEIPDIPGIAALCESAGKPLLVDSTMAAPLNATPLKLGASVVIHSTSKYLSGSNTHGGGVVLCNDPAWAEPLRAAQNRLEHGMSPTEFPSLLEGLNTFESRLKRFNANGQAMADLLRTHPAVETVYFANQGRPAWLKGLAGVVSCELRHPTLAGVKTFFDAPLPGVIKAPSLGSDQTLFCPYVLLAYYDKSDAYLEDCGLSKSLLRFAMGSEKDIAPVLAGVSEALDQVLDGCR